MEYTEFMLNVIQKNISSCKLLNSLNFRKEGHLISNVFFWKDEDNNPIWKDTLIFALLNK